MREGREREEYIEREGREKERFRHVGSQLVLKSCRRGALLFLEYNILGDDDLRERERAQT